MKTTLELIKYTIKWILMGFFGSAIFEINTSLMNKPSTMWFFTGVLLNIALFTTIVYVFVKDYTSVAPKLDEKTKKQKTNKLNK